MPGNIKLLNLQDINFTDDIPETSPTLEGNALQKARLIYDKFQIGCFADDTGLEIEALDGRPGVYSARYAGEDKNTEANMNKVLLELGGAENRKARFRTVIALILDGKEHLFDGVVNGVILTEKRGGKGFGYDPIFMPEGHPKSFAEMTLEEKNNISHRAIAVKKLIEFLRGL